MAEETKARIESELEVKAYIQDLKFSLNNGAQIDFQVKRVVDEKRDEKYTNQYTVNRLFPDENPVGIVWKYNYFCNVISFCREGIYSRNVPL